MAEPTPRAPLRYRTVPPLAMLAAFAAGLGSVAAGATLVRAADNAGVFEFVRSQGQRRPAAQPAAVRPAAPAGPARYTSASVPARFEVLHPPARPASAVPMERSAEASGARTVCVRTCDGYLFPLGNLSPGDDLSVHREACTAACPGAQVALFTLRPGQEDMTRAVSLSGQSYGSLPYARAYLKRRNPDCNCQGRDGALATPFPIHRDRTLRLGDMVSGRESASVLVAQEGRRRFVDVRRAVLARSDRREVERVTGIERRDAARASFRRLIQVQHAERQREGTRIRVAAIGGDPGFRILSARASFDTVRVVVPSPYRP